MLAVLSLTINGPLPDLLRYRSYQPYVLVVILDSSLTWSCCIHICKCCIQSRLSCLLRWFHRRCCYTCIAAHVALVDRNVYGLVNVGAVLSLTVAKLHTWFAAALPQLSTRPCSVIILDPWRRSPALSVNVAFNPVEQLSASLVTSPVAVTHPYVHVALVWIVMFAGLVCWCSVIRYRNGPTRFAALRSCLPNSMFLLLFLIPDDMDSLPAFTYL
jgi:uncharacterized membrane protein